MSPEHGESGNQGFRILLIDDNVDANESMGSLLTMLGYDVRMANDGDTGLQIAIDFRPHLVLSDIGLPGMSGYQLAPALRQAAGQRKLVLAAATGYGFASDAARIIDAGFDFHFVKPLDAEALLAFVARQCALAIPGAGTAADAAPAR
ncbi:MAG: chemotaxis protein methyltransferase CheR [Paucimonas sp.]|nr:chemotaxis protein methyltransferase CheR [Paucimonas sp.]